MWVGADIGIYVAVVGSVSINASEHNCQTHFGLAQDEQLARESNDDNGGWVTWVHPHPRRGEGHAM